MFRKGRKSKGFRKKKVRMCASDTHPYFAFLLELALDGGTNGASAGASAALDALISVDDVLAVAFSDGINGAFSLASAASDAFISDNVSHGYTSNKFESSD